MCVCVCDNLSTGHLRYLEIKGNGETTSSFPKFEISKLRPAKILRKSQHFHIRGLIGSPVVFHHLYPTDNDFKRIFPDLTHVKMFCNNSSDDRLCVDINSAKTDLDFEHRHRKGETNVLVSVGRELSLRHSRVFVITEFDTSKVEIK